MLMKVFEACSVYVFLALPVAMLLGDLIGKAPKGEALPAGEGDREDDFGLG